MTQTSDAVCQTTFLLLKGIAQKKKKKKLAKQQQQKPEFDALEPT